MEQGSTGLGEGGPRPRERKGSPIYSVELEVFEGPLDLLLHLVRKHELDILDIPIAFVAEKYLEYLEVMRQLDLEIAGDYLVMAATLAYLKSRELLPPEPRSGEAGQSEEEEGEDPREALIRRLVEYERFKQAAAELDSLPVSGRDVFARGAELVMPPVDPGLAPVSLFNLAEAYYRVLTRAKVKSTHEVQIEAVTVAQRIKQLALILDEKPHFEFEELFLNRTWNSERELRAMLVVTLMSILEMVKLGVAGVQQPHDSPTIRIYRRASAEQTQQALADYDEDASFGAPKPKDGEATPPPGPSAPPRAAEAELDAVEEAALLAEALASVQEPEEPVEGYADEGEDVAANDPASEYDDEPRPPQRRSRSERRGARSSPDVLEDRDEALDAVPDGRLVIVQGDSAEVTRDGRPRRRLGDLAGLADDEAASAALRTEDAEPREDVLGDMPARGGEADAAEERSSSSTREDERSTEDAEAREAATAAPSRSEDVLEDISLAREGGGGGSPDVAAAGAAVEPGEGLDAIAEAAGSRTDDAREDTSPADEEDGSPESSRGLDSARAVDISAGLDAVAGAVQGGLARQMADAGPAESTDAADDAEDVLGDSSSLGRGAPESTNEAEEALVDVSPADGLGATESTDDARGEAEDGRGGRLPVGEVEAAEPMAAAGDEVGGDSLGRVPAHEIEASESTAEDEAEDVLEDSLPAGRAEAGESPAADEAEDVLEDRFLSGAAEAAESSAGDEAEAVLGDGLAVDEAVESTAAAAADDEAAEVLLASLAVTGTAVSRVAAGGEIAGDVLGDNLPAGELAAEESTTGAEAAKDVFGRAPAGEVEAAEPISGDEAEDDPRDSEPGSEVEAAAPTAGDEAEDGLADSLLVDGSEAAESTAVPADEVEDVAGDRVPAGANGAVESAAAAADEAAGDVFGDSVPPGASETVESPGAREDEAGSGFGDSLVVDELPAAEPTDAAGDEVRKDVLGDSLPAGELETESTGAAGDEDRGDVLRDSLPAGELETESTGAVEGDVLGDSLPAGELETESTDAAGDEVAEDGPGRVFAGELEASESSAGDEVAGDGLGRVSAGEVEAAGSTVVVGDTPEDALRDSLLRGRAAASESTASRAASEEGAGAAAEEDALEHGQATGERAVDPAGSDVAARDTEDEREPVGLDSDDDEAGGLFLNTGEGLGARELGDVDDDEDDAQ
ncbi:condensin subunit ScpA [Nannocystis exedens]|uniref:Segregation and condensation protein A n=1 Tax=Nannocystis exedens TaxID=54 RepID=A0A1I1TB96_9BACT|nr:segregation/condensation protein A [Nannocystis exedens]PCC66785.1 segregation and condensation protein A [Nannocystis exedens]SFD53583.1 condensin subunit ScpA [Nannocystis exedens]